MDGSDKASVSRNVQQVRDDARSYVAELRQARLARLHGTATAKLTPNTQEPSMKRRARTPARGMHAAGGKRGKRVDVSAYAPSDAPGGSEAAQDALHQDALADLARLSGKAAQTPTPKAKAPAKSAGKKKPPKKTIKQKAQPGKAAAPDPELPTPRDKPAPKRVTATPQEPAPAHAPAPPVRASHVDRPAPALSSQLTTRAARHASRLSHRQAAREGVAKARAAAHTAQQKMRDARLTQRTAAAKQREAAAKQRHQSAGAPPARAVAGRVNLASRSGAARPSAAPLPSPSLTALRGIGEAMSRRLEKVGIASLEDLLTIDAADLRGRLGPISALANIEGWQEQAAELRAPGKTR